MTIITILGPTATGKTALAAKLAERIGGEVISADSRQVYRGMDIGTGKDLGDYFVNGKQVQVHLVDILEPGQEYNIFHFQRDFHQCCTEIKNRGRQVILCGGSGMYIEAVLKGYRMPEIEEDETIMQELSAKSDEELFEMLKELKPLHNKTDTEDRSRAVKAILIARNTLQNNERKAEVTYPPVDSVIIGISMPRGLVKSRITARLNSRLENGMIQEVEHLLALGISPERLIRYGLEYKYVTQHLLGELTRQQMFDALNIAIRQFAKRQMTWFRRMERNNFNIHWIDGRLGDQQKLELILPLISKRQ